jgi:hypothetical protein
VSSKAACIAKAEAVLNDLSGGIATTSSTRDGVLFHATALIAEGAIQVVCYEVDDPRGGVVSVITAAGFDTKSDTCAASSAVFQRMRD